MSIEAKLESFIETVSSYSNEKKASKQNNTANLILNHLTSIFSC